LLKFRAFYIFSFILALQVPVLSGQAQVTDSSCRYKNIIRLNLSNPVLFGIKNNVLGYERILKKNQSFSVNIGRFSFPKFEPLIRDSFQLQKNYKDKGFHFSIDYRWYLQKENKYAAPRGFYVGPYYAYNYLERENYWMINTDSYQGELVSNLNVNMHLIGVQLGCQFVVWKRLTLDVIFMGPGLWFFTIKSKTSSVSDSGESQLVYQQLDEQINDQVPVYGQFIDDTEFSEKGSARTGKFGYRYLVNLGFRF
jgi:hypothetical protein